MVSAPVDASRGLRSLADDLRGRDDAALTTLLRGRPDLVTPVPSDVARLAERAATRSSVALALDRLDRFALQVVEALAVLPEPAVPEDVRALLDGPAEDVDRVLARLHELALLWGPPDAPRLVRTATELLGTAPAGLGPPATTLLLSQSPVRLDRLAGLLDAPATADALAAALADGTTVERLLDDAGPAAREAVGAMAWGPPTGRLADALREVEPETARTPVEALLARGLLLPVAHDTVALPREVALHLRGGRLHRSVEVSAPAPEVSAHDPGLVDRLASAAAVEVVRRVELLLEAWADQPATSLRAGGIGLRELRRAATLADVDEATAALLLEIAYVGGLLSSSTRGSVDGWLPTPAYDAWLRASIATRWATLALAWATTSRAAALVARPSAAERDRVAALGPELDRPAQPDVRREALRVLAGVEPGGAPDPAGVRAVVAWRRPRRAPAPRDALVDATLAEAATLGLTAQGALATYGRVLAVLDLAEHSSERGERRDRAADPAAGRRRAAAVAEVAAALDPLLPAPLDTVLLQADLTAVAPGPLEPPLARSLALLADVESSGGATVYRFSAASVRRAFDAGVTAAEVLELLTSASRTPVPQPLAYLVEDVARRHGRLRIGAATALVVGDDPALLAEVLADPRAADLALRRVAPTVLASPAEPAFVLRTLRALGHAPATEAADGSLVLGRPEPRRAPATTPPRPVRTAPPRPDDALLEAAVAAIRAGDEALRTWPAPAGARRDTRAGRPVGRTGSAPVLEVLRHAADAGEVVRLGYVDRAGAVRERLVEPVAVAGGWLTAYDLGSRSVRTYAVHRISSVVPRGAAGPADGEP